MNFLIVKAEEAKCNSTAESLLVALNLGFIPNRLKYISWYVKAINGWKSSSTPSSFHQIVFKIKLGVSLKPHYVAVDPELNKVFMYHQPIEIARAIL